jgi:hypothetical protein
VKAELIGKGGDVPVVRRDQLAAVLGDDPVCEAVGAPAPTAHALRRLVKLHGDARVLQQLGAPEPGQPRALHEDADTIVDMAHPGTSGRGES